MNRIIFLIIFICIFTALASQSPRNPIMNIGNMNPDFSTVINTENTFNAARRAEEMQLGLAANSIANLDLPSQTVWDGYTSDQKMLFLLNDERTARAGINYGDGPVKGLPFKGVEAGQDGVSQTYAQLLLDNNAFTHTFNGTTSGSRLDAAIPAVCREFIARSENLYGAGGFNNNFPTAVEGAVYVFNYEDATSALGHREMCLLQDNDLAGNPWGFNDNNGDAGQEGFIGLGIATGNNSLVLVLNYYDPVADAVAGACPYNVTVTTNSLMGGGGNPPAGYTCATAIPISAAGTYMAPAADQGNGAGDPGVGTHAIWYLFTPPTTGMINVTSCGIAANTGVMGGGHNHIYPANTTCATVPAALNGNGVFTTSNSCGNQTATENIPVTAGVPVYIEWDDGVGGAAFTWNLEYVGGGGCPANVTVSAATTMGNTLASAAITTQGTVVANTAVFSAPAVNINGDFSVPAGQCFEVNNVGCAYTGTLTCDGGGPGQGMGTCASPYVLTCGTPFMGNNTGATSAWVNYIGNGLDSGQSYPGPETIHTLSVPAGATRTITLSGLGAAVDLDLFITSACDSNTLITLDGANNGAGGDDGASITNASASAGILYIIVDGWNGDVGAYTLTCN